MGIKSLLIEIALKRKDEIGLKVGIKKEIKEKIKELWREELPQPSTPKRVKAVDGSRNRKDYAGYVIYAVGACSLLFKEGVFFKENYSAYIDLLKPEEYSDSRLRNLMGIVEIKEALREIEETDALLIDGSIIGNAIRPVVFENRVNEKAKEWTLRLFKEVKEELLKEVIGSSLFYREVEKHFPGDDYPLVAGYLEYLEYLFTIYKLLERGKGKIIAVSKHSNSRKYGLDAILPDITVLNEANLPPGYTKYKEVPLGEKKFSFPGELEELLAGKKFKVFYFKLSKSKGVYKCETDMEVEKALGILRFYEVMGYPYPLMEAHKRVKITNREMEQVIELLSFKGTTGREALNE